MGVGSIEIECSACGEETFIRREPVYDGFDKVGEKLICTACGHEFADEAEVSFKEKSAPSVFTEDDAPKQINIFQDDEKNKNCRHCNYYVVNPFMQRCDLHSKKIEATDLCGDFVLKVEEKEGGEEDR